MSWNEELARKVSRFSLLPSFLASVQRMLEQELPLHVTARISPEKSGSMVRLVHRDRSVAFLAVSREEFEAAENLDWVALFSRCRQNAKHALTELIEPRRPYHVSFRPGRDRYPLGKP